MHSLMPEFFRDQPPLAWDGAAPARQDRTAFLFGAMLVYLVGIAGRATAFHSLWRGVECALIIDTVVLLLVLLNRRLMRVVQKHIRGYVMAAYIFVNSALSACLIILFTRVLGAVLPALATPWAQLPNAQFIYFAYLFVSWAVAGRWLDERARLSDERIGALAARSAVLQSEMQQLRLQLSPHFLFNTLNMLAVDIPDRPRRALHALRELSRYLRYTLDNAERSSLPAAKEIAGLRSFMRIHRMRYGNALKLSITVDGSLRGHRLPTFLLQPLVENATKHGVAGGNGRLEVLVRVVAEADVMRITVINGGDLATPSAMPGTGTGLANTRRRLALHYPERHSFSLAQAGGLVEAQLVLRGAPC